MNGASNYTYAGSGDRVRKDAASWTEYLIFGGNSIAKKTPTGWADYIFLQGRRFAETTALDSSTVQFYWSDHLNSARVMTSSSGSKLCDTYFAPFGQEVGGSPCPSQYKFTGKERDSETGLDYFGARYYGSNMGRWSSPDILNLTEDRVLNPANTLNKYAYAANNPLRFGDPDGRDVTALFLPPHGVFPGHFMLFAHNPSNGQSALISLGPVDTSWGSRAIQVVNGPVDGTTSFGIPKSADQLRQGYAALTIQTSPEEAQAVIDFLRSFDGSSWRLGGPNCTTVCRDALKAIGILPPDYGSISPASLWSGLYERFSNPATQTFTTTNLRYGEQGFRLNVPSAQGRDYGFPRYGMNTFDFIMLQLKRPKACVEARDDKGNSTGTTCSD